MQPTNDRVLVKRDDPENMTAGGLHIPENAKLKSRQGVIVAVGPGPFLKDSNEHRPLGLELGQRVCWRGINGSELEWNGEMHVMLREDEIEGVIED